MDTRRTRISGVAKRMAPLLGLAAFAAALVMIQRLLSHVEPADLARQLGRTPRPALLSAAVMTAGSYLSLSGFDGLGVAYVGHRLAPARVMLISFIAHGVSHSAGFATLSGGAIRLRLYGAAGLSAAEIAAVIGFCGVTFAAGACTVAAVALLAEPTRLAALFVLPDGILRGLGGAAAAVVVAYVVWGASSPPPLRIFGRSVAVPGLPMALAQIIVAAVDLALAAGALYVLLPTDGRLSYAAFLGLYVMANLLGLLAHVPGGLGVFEAAVLAMTPAPAPAVLSALLLFRAVYNLLPLALAALCLLAFELSQGR
ncbi:MAG TPA: UPF0104 family protein [Rhodospirillaceae bacterium]|nr:UPF0104 family protein [Rhodospirillaceae bacterium]